MAPIFLFPKTSIDSHMKSHEISWILVLRLVLSPRRNQKQRKHLSTLPWTSENCISDTSLSPDWIYIYIYYIIYIILYILYYIYYIIYIILYILYYIILYILYYIYISHPSKYSNQKKKLNISQYFSMKSVRSPHEMPMEITKKASRGLVRGPGFSLGNESRGRRLVSMCLTRKVDLI